MYRLAKITAFSLAALAVLFAVWASPLLFNVGWGRGFVDPILPNLLGQEVTKKFTRFQDLRVGLPSEVYEDETGISFDCNQKHPPEEIHLADISRCRIAFASTIAAKRCPFLTQGSYCTGIHVPAFFFKDEKYRSMLSEVLLRPCSVIRELEGAESGDWYKRLGCGEERSSARLRLVVVEISGKTVKPSSNVEGDRRFYLFFNVRFIELEITLLLSLPD